VLCADRFDHGLNLLAVGSGSKIVGGEALGVQLFQRRKILADEVEVNPSRAGFEKQGLGAEEAGIRLLGLSGHGVKCPPGVSKPGQQGRTQNPGSQPGFP